MLDVFDLKKCIKFVQNISKEHNKYFIKTIGKDKRKKIPKYTRKSAKKHTRIKLLK